MISVVRYAEAALPTRWATFRVVVYRFGDEEQLALVKGDVKGGAPVLTRVHSECITGDVLGSLRCDCRQQLHTALERIAAAPAGVLVYLRQEGRGIGLGNKIRAYALQDDGRDTVDANRELGFEDDLRSYEQAAAILKDLGIASVELMTNNPRKSAGLEAGGVKVATVQGIWTEPTAHNQNYLSTKQSKLGHIKKP